MDTRTYARNTTARRLDTLAAEIKRTLDAPDADAVHDLRVSIRRFKQALSVFADWLPAKEARKARRALRKVMDAAGRVRDRDIAREILDRSRAEQAPAMSEAIGPHRDQAARELVAEAGRLWLKNVGVTWREPLGLNAPFVQPMPAEAAPQPEAAPAPAAEKETDRDIGAMARASLPLAAHKYFEAGRRAMDRRRSAKALHQFRIQSKHFRYTLELFAELYGPKLSQILKSVRSVQSILGDLNDCVAAGEILAALGAGPELAAAIRRRQRNRTRQFLELWAGMASPDEEQHWAVYLRRYARGRKAGLEMAVSMVR